MIKKIDIPQSTVIDASVLWGGINDNVLAAKINEVIDAVNKHEDIIRQIGEWGSSKGECLWCENLTNVNLDGEPQLDDLNWSESKVAPYNRKKDW